MQALFLLNIANKPLYSNFTLLLHTFNLLLAVTERTQPLISSNCQVMSAMNNTFAALCRSFLFCVWHFLLLLLFHWLSTISPQFVICESSLSVVRGTSANTKIDIYPFIYNYGNDTSKTASLTDNHMPLKQRFLRAMVNVTNILFPNWAEILWLLCFSCLSMLCTFEQDVRKEIGYYKA